jgi:hypothetical protein
MVDMGLCKQYREPKTKRHIPYRLNKKLTGTPRYASIHTHNGEEQGRRDDLESLGYMLIYFNKGKLPWQGLKARTKQEKYDLIGKRKREISVEELCRGCPGDHFFSRVFLILPRRDGCLYELLSEVTIRRRTKLLLFEESCRNGDLEPGLIFQFYNLIQQRGYQCDWIFDWDDLVTDFLIWS